MKAKDIEQALKLSRLLETASDQRDMLQDTSIIRLLLNMSKPLDGLVLRFCLPGAYGDEDIEYLCPMSEAHLEEVKRVLLRALDVQIAALQAALRNLGVEEA